MWTWLKYGGLRKSLPLAFSRGHPRARRRAQPISISRGRPGPMMTKRRAHSARTIFGHRSKSSQRKRNQQKHEHVSEESCLPDESDICMMVSTPYFAQKRPNTMLYYTIYTILYDTITILYDTTLYNAILYYNILYYSIL